MSDGLLVQTMQRIMSVLDDIDERKADIKEIYAEANSNGFDKAAIGVAIREIRGRAKAETPKAQERASIVELYVSAFDNAPRTYVHVPAREAGSEPIPHRVHAPATQDEHHVDRSASAQPDSAEGRPAIPSMPGDAGNGQGSQTDTIGQLSGAGTGSAVRAGARVSNTSLGPLTAAQSEGAAGANPEEAAPDSVTESEVVTPQAQGAEFVTPASEGEGVRAPADPSLAADEPIKGLAAANAIAASVAIIPSSASRRVEVIDIEIPAFLRRTTPGNHPSFGEQA